jgi:hypothetical protein
LYSGDACALRRGTAEALDFSRIEPRPTVDKQFLRWLSVPCLISADTAGNDIGSEFLREMILANFFRGPRAHGALEHDAFARVQKHLGAATSLTIVARIIGTLEHQTNIANPIANIGKRPRFCPGLIVDSSCDIPCNGGVVLHLTFWLTLSVQILVRGNRRLSHQLSDSLAFQQLRLKLIVEMVLVEMFLRSGIGFLEEVALLDQLHSLGMG